MFLVHFVCLFSTCLFLSFFIFFWCRGLVAVCDCGTPWTFLLTFLSFDSQRTGNVTLKIANVATLVTGIFLFLSFKIKWSILLSH